ncbi:MAG: DUF1934 domain-containing protein [Clostridia bacterium]|nr:DUF1934 domain-containing protein [Clostridia bacterium]
MDCKIKITTTQVEYRGKSIFDRAAEELMIAETFSDYDAEGTMETFLSGRIELTGTECVLTYEDESSDMGITYTELKFDTKMPESISLVRQGGLESFMMFEPGKRHICVYNTGIMPFEICIYSKSVDNRLLSDGILEINYFVEIKGACAQKTTFKMEIKKI